MAFKPANFCVPIIKKSAYFFGNNFYDGKTKINYALLTKEFGRVYL